MKEEFKERKREVWNAIRKLRRRVKKAEGDERSHLLAELHALENLLEAYKVAITYLNTRKKGGEVQVEFPLPEGKEEIERRVYSLTKAEIGVEIDRMRDKRKLHYNRVYRLKKRRERLKKKKGADRERKELTAEIYRSLYLYYMLRRDIALFTLFFLKRVREEERSHGKGRQVA